MENDKSYHESMVDEPSTVPPSLMPAPGEDTSCALALVNTRHMHAGQPTDLIADQETAGGWLADRELIPAGSAVTGSDAVRLRELRESIRALLTARSAGLRPADADVALLNETLAAAPPIPALAWDDSGPHRTDSYRIPPGVARNRRPPDGQERPSGLASGPAAQAEVVIVALARLADDALALLTASGRAEPAPCGARGCIRWFLRTHAARQWCSTRCGDRVRAARHYARHGGVR
jgi:predicted RNA-binding Zn ribbon-like protein